MPWHQIQIQRLVSHYRQLDCWGIYATAGGAPPLTVRTVRNIGALREVLSCRTKGCDKYTELIDPFFLLLFFWTVFLSCRGEILLQSSFKAHVDYGKLTCCFSIAVSIFSIAVLIFSIAVSTPQYRPTPTFSIVVSSTLWCQQPVCSYVRIIAVDLLDK